MTKVINLRDNCYDGERYYLRKNGINNKPQITNYQFVGLSELAKLNLKDEYKNILIFPKSLNDIKDGSQDLPILSLKDEESEGNNIKVVSISTGNLMGFIGNDKVTVSIHSRFTNKTNKSGEQIFGEDYFLYYMLQRVFHINLVSLDHGTNHDDQILDFLLFMFPDALKKALAQGLYKEYQTRDFDDARVRGTILVNQTIRKDIPFRGKISYRTRIHSHDNSITQLVRHTIEHIKRHPFGKAILNNDRETKEYVDRIVMATPSYSPRDKDKVVKANLRPKIHPYFLKYADLQKLCLRILRHDTLKYGDDKDKIHGILFDGAWLWEEYLNTILSDLEFTHPRNKDGKGSIPMFVLNKKNRSMDTQEIFQFNMFPDFYLPNSSENNQAHIILDAKYKRLDNGVDRNDLFQVISYMHCMKAKHGGYIYPYTESEKDIKYPEGKLNGMGGAMHAIPFTVPNNSESWKDFNDKIRKSENELRNKVEELKESLTKKQKNDNQ